MTAALDGGVRAEATEVVVSVEGGGDVDAVDFQDVRSFGITIPAGNKSGEGTFTLTPIDDDVDESNETLDVEGSSDLPVRAGTVELLDDDVPSAAILLSAKGRRAASACFSSSRSAGVRAASGGRTCPVLRPINSPQYLTMGTGRPPPSFLTVLPHQASDSCFMGRRRAS